MILRSKESLFLEFRQLLNLLFRHNGHNGLATWKQDPFKRAVESFCVEASKVASRQELRSFVLDKWLRENQSVMDHEVRSSVNELLNAHLPLHN